MSEKPLGVAETPNAEDIKKQMVAELEREIQQKKQHFSAMIEDREKWKMQSIFVGTLQRQLGNNEFDPGTEKRKLEELAKCQQELKKIEGECYKKYKVQTAKGLRSAIDNYKCEIERKQEALQVLQGVPYVFGQRKGQSQQGQEDHIQQRVKGIAETQAEFPVAKNNETVQSHDHQGQNQNTVLKVTFQSQRERFNQDYKSKVQEERERDRSPRGREM